MFATIVLVVQITAILLCLPPICNGKNRNLSANKALVLLSEKLRAGRFKESIQIAHSLFDVPPPVKNIASFSKLLCLFFTGKKENLGEEFQKAGEKIESLPARQKTLIWKFIEKSRISFKPNNLTIIYRKNKKINPDSIMDSYMGIAVFLGNLNQIAPIQDAQKILFSLLDLIEEPSLAKTVEKPELKKQIILSQILRNQEYLQILTKNAPIEIGTPAT